MNPELRIKSCRLPKETPLEKLPLYSKPLKIVCIGRAEKLSREQYGNLPGAKCTARKKKFMEFFAENGIQYVGATDMLIALCGSQ